jgi:MFS family permease
MSAQPPAKAAQPPSVISGKRWRAVRGALAGFSSRSRCFISEHRQRRRSRDREISDQSRRGLDWTNFFMADVQMSFGSFLAFYLASLGWSKQDVGLALTVGGAAGVIALIPGGALADAIRSKQALAAVGVVMIAISALMLALWPSYELVFLAEVLHGATAGVVGPAIAAISLGLTGRAGMSLRVGRNYRFSAAGNVLTAGAMGALGVYATSSAIFIATALLCIPTLIALAQIRAVEIDYARARNAMKRNDTLQLQKVIELSKNRNLLLFACCIALYQFSNASLLPLVSQNLAQTEAILGPLFMAGLIIVPQIVVALLAPWIGYWSEIWGRKPLLLIALILEVARALVYTFVTSPYLMMATQLLDGITGAIVTVLVILVITDFTAGTGRFNLAQGAVGTLTGIAAAVSTGALGFIVQRYGDVTGFLTMAAVTATSAALLWTFVPESKPAEYND